MKKKVCNGGKEDSGCICRDIARVKGAAERELYQETSGVEKILHKMKLQKLNKN